MRRRALLLIYVALAVIASAPANAHELHGCSRAVIFTLPGLTWSDVTRWDPPHLVALTEQGAIGSVSVRTVTSKTTYASGFATIGAGNRLDGGAIAGGPRADQPNLEQPGLVRDVEVGGLEVLKELALEADYGATPGALGTALGSIPAQALGNADLGIPPPAPVGYGRWTLLAAMDVTGTVDRAATSALLLKTDPGAPYGVRTDPVAFGSALQRALSETCALTVIDHGDLTRADRLSEALGTDLSEARRDALLAADEMLGRVAEQMDFSSDLLLVLAPTSPAPEEATHFGVGLAVGEQFPAGSWLESPSTRRDGLVTLVDVAPTVLEHLHRERAASMTGRAWFASAAGDVDDRVAEAISLDEESVFVDRMRTPVVTGFVIFQIAVYVLIALLFLRERNLRTRRRKNLFSVLEIGALAVVAFPAATYLAGIGDSHELGAGLFVAALIAIDLLMLAVVRLLLKQPMDRLLALTASTVVVLMVDLIVGGPLQLNTVLSYSPIVAGRFSGLGNIAFAVLAGATLMTGTLIVQRWPRSRWALIARKSVV